MSERIDVVHPPRKQRLKAAFLADVRLAGGQEEASRYTGRGQQRISKWGGKNTDAFPPIDAVLDLSDVITGLPGAPNTIRALCEEAGGVFVPLPGMPESSEPCELMVMRLNAEFGDVSRVVAEDIAADGKIDDARIAAKALRELDEAIRLGVQLRMALEKIADRGR